MDDKFEGFGPVMKGIAGKPPADRSNNSGRVVDLEAYRNNRYYGFGKGTSQRRATHDSPEMIKHEDEAIALGNSHSEPQGRAAMFKKAAKFIGLID